MTAVDSRPGSGGVPPDPAAGGGALGRATSGRRGDQSSPGSQSFSDVGVTPPFRLEVKRLASTGIAAGYAGGTFHPIELVTRQAAAAFVHRHARADL